MRVLLVNDLPPGGASGAEVHLALLEDGLRRAGDEVDVFTGAPRSPLLELWDPFARRRLREAVRGFRPDVVHVHNVVRELTVSVLGATGDVPVVMTAHDGRLLGDADGQRAVPRAYQRARAPFDAAVARRHVDRLLAVSGPLAQRFSAAGFASVVHAAPWAATPVAPVVPAADCRDLVFLGRLQADKGVHVLLDAMTQVDARLLLAGTGDDVRVHPAVREGRAVLLGRQTHAEVSRLLGSARALVLPSLPARRPEGSPLVLAEALVHGRPLVVSDDPGAVELTRGGTCGLVTPAGDVDALATALRSVVEDDALVARLAAAATATGPDHGERAGLARVRAAYESVTA